jgi:hypothetical protein
MALGKAALAYTVFYNNSSNRLKKFCEELIPCFPLIRTAWFVYSLLRNMFPQPLPSNDEGNTHRDTRTDGMDL